MERATQLVLELCGGSAGPVAVAELATYLPQRKSVEVRLSRVARVLGEGFDSAAVSDIFTRLGFTHLTVEGGFCVTPPAHRFDIAIEEDLIEEIARVHGYNRIAAVAPMVTAKALPQVERRRSLPGVRRALAARDYQEVVTYSFVDRAWEQDFCANAAPIALANPIATQMSVMRSSLIGGLVSTLAYNLHHKQPRVRVFEVGRCFMAGGAVHQQPWRIGAAACGDTVHDQWGVRPPRRADFFDVKADVEALLQIHGLTFEAGAHPALHPGKSARLLHSGNTIGWLGELHPRWQQKYDLPMAPVLFEVELEAAMMQALPAFGGISKFPPVLRDLAVIVDEKTPYQAIFDAVNAQKPASILEFAVFDIYRGQGIENGKKSLAFRMLVQDTHKTLTDAEVDSAVSEIIKILQNQFNAKLR